MTDAGASEVDSGGAGGTGLLLRASRSASPSLVIPARIRVSGNRGIRGRESNGTKKNRMGERRRQKPTHEATAVSATEPCADS
jgi:hypothetical protein